MQRKKIASKKYEEFKIVSNSDATPATTATPLGSSAPITAGMMMIPVPQMPIQHCYVAHSNGFVFCYQPQNVMQPIQQGGQVAQLKPFYSIDKAAEEAARANVRQKKRLQLKKKTPIDQQPVEGQIAEQQKQEQSYSQQGGVGQEWGQEELRLPVDGNEQSELSIPEIGFNVCVLDNKGNVDSQVTTSETMIENESQESTVLLNADTQQQYEGEIHSQQNEQASEQSPEKVLDSKEKTEELVDQYIKSTLESTALAQDSLTSKKEITASMIDYFLSKNLELVAAEQEEEVTGIQNDSSYNSNNMSFNSRLLRFMNREYEIESVPLGNSTSFYSNTVITRQADNRHRQKHSDNSTSYSRNSNKHHVSNNQNKKHYDKSTMQQEENETTIIRRSDEDKEPNRLVSVYLEHCYKQNKDKKKKLINDIRQITNILTPTNFQLLQEDVFQLIVDASSSTQEETVEVCSYLADGIIEKARTFSAYMQVYANLCLYLINQSVTQFKDTNPVAASCFRTLLINDIQHTFEGKKDVLDNKMTIRKKSKQKKIAFCQTFYHKSYMYLKENESEQMKMSVEDRSMYLGDKKRREMQNILFVGHLFLNKTIPIAVLRVCLSSLVKDFMVGLCDNGFHALSEAEENFYSSYELKLEEIIATLELTGLAMYEQSLKKVQNKSDLFDRFIEQVVKEKVVNSESVRLFKYAEFIKMQVGEVLFVKCIETNLNRIEWVEKEKNVSPRIYSLVQNLLERKNNAWKDKSCKSQGPLIASDLVNQQGKTPTAQPQQLQQVNRNGSQGSDHRQVENQSLTRHAKDKVNQSYDKVVLSAKDIWAQLHLKSEMVADTLLASHSVFKQLRNQTTATIFAEALLGTVYDCNAASKQKRLAVVLDCLGESSLVTAAEFMDALSHRLSYSKDESSDFPFFYELLSKIFWEMYKKHLFSDGDGGGGGGVKFSSLKIHYDAKCSEDERENVVFVFQQFAEEKKSSNFDLDTFVNEEVSYVLRNAILDYETWAVDLKK